MRLSIIAVVLAGILSVAPTTSSAQTASDSQAVLSIDTKLFFSTLSVVNSYHPHQDKFSHEFIDTLTKVFVEPSKVAYWMNNAILDDGHQAVLDKAATGWSISLNVDRKALLVKSLEMDRTFTNFNEEHPEFQIRFENIPMWSDGKNFIIDIHAPFPSFYFHYVGFFDTFGVELYKDIDSARSHILIRLREEHLLNVPSAKESRTFRIMSNVQSRSAIVWFAPSSGMRTLQVYNTLGKCVKEILIQPNTTSEEIAFHSLPTGHYTARLGSDAHSFAVWR